MQAHSKMHLFGGDGSTCGQFIIFIIFIDCKMIPLHEPYSIEYGGEP